MARSPNNLWNLFPKSSHESDNSLRSCVLAQWDQQCRSRTTSQRSRSSRHPLLMKTMSPMSGESWGALACSRASTETLVLLIAAIMQGQAHLQHRLCRYGIRLGYIPENRFRSPNDRFPTERLGKPLRVAIQCLSRRLPGSGPRSKDPLADATWQMKMQR